MKQLFHVLITMVVSACADDTPGSELGNLKADVDAGTPIPESQPLGVGKPTIAVLPLVQDGIPYSGPPDTVELVTDWISGNDTSMCPNGAGHWCAQVTLTHFYSVPKPNVYVQITKIHDGKGVPVSGQNASNSDASPYAFLDGSRGLWGYGALIPPSTQSSRVWEFPDKGEPYPTYTIRVVSIGQSGGSPAQGDTDL